MNQRLALVLALAAGAASPTWAQGAVTLDPRITQLLGAVSSDRIKATVDKLTSFRTRNSLSSTTSTTAGIGAARQWILNEMKGYSPRLQVSLDGHRIPPGGRIPREVELVNVMAVLPGKSPRRVYVSGHYDTVVLRPAAEDTAAARTGDNPAPGANDDGSGTALTMELARVFAQSGLEFDATLVFIVDLLDVK